MLRAGMSMSLRAATTASSTSGLEIEPTAPRTRLVPSAGTFLRPTGLALMPMVEMPGERTADGHGRAGADEEAASAEPTTLRRLHGSAPASDWERAPYQRC